MTDTKKEIVSQNALLYICHMKSSLRKIELVRKQRILLSSKEHKDRLGQYITPMSIANFMSENMPIDSTDDFKILDPGAGLGTLSFTFISRLLKYNPLSKIHLDCYEIDKSIIPLLKATFKQYDKSKNVDINYIEKDFISESSFNISFNTNCDYSHIIMNPPYKKINSHSSIKSALRDVGIETVNYYSAFLSLAILQLKDNGYIAAIIPRSFCNGLYYLPFRKLLTEQTKIRRIHLFHSRSDSFKEESVLQENIIIILQKSKLDSEVVISTSMDSSFNGYVEYKCSIDTIIKPNDNQLYISIPTIEANDDYTLFAHYSDLGISISTGPIVDFRVKDFLEQEINFSNVPLIYPCHLKNFRLLLAQNSKKPNAIRPDREDIKRSLFPKGNYILIRRFSSKEEKKRVVASIILESDFNQDYFAVENHLNIIHIERRGLPIDLAYGLLAFYNSNYFDNKFREFSGHTQVNSTDLKNMKYPTYDQLINLGKMVMTSSLSENNFDHLLNLQVGKNEN